MDFLGEPNMSMTSYYQSQFKDGIEYQDFIFDTLYGLGLPLISYSSKKYQCEKGENKAGIEIKYDKKFRITGNLYIETDEKSNENIQNYTRSGIFRDDKTWLYLIGDYKTIYVFAKRHLVMKAKSLREVITPTYIGVLLPLKEAENLACRIINLEIEKK